MTDQTSRYRNLIGYAGKPPQADWPGGARVAVSFVLNYEEGAEYSILKGDAHAESILSDLAAGPPLVGQRNLNIESLYEYGSRVGVWNLLELFERKRVPVTIYAVADALELNPAAAGAIRDSGNEVVSHGLRWIDYQDMPEAEEEAHMRRSVEIIERTTGQRPVGWYTGRPSGNTRRLAARNGFLYDCDAYNDDLPYWVKVEGRQHLVVPYSFDNNDSRFGRAQGFDVADEFFTYLRDGFDYLWRQGETSPRMMSIGLHCRQIGRPGRILGLERFIDHVLAHERVWCCWRRDIARHWMERHPFDAATAFELYPDGAA